MNLIDVAQVFDSLSEGVDVAQPHGWPEIGIGSVEVRQLRLNLKADTLRGLTERRQTDESVRWVDATLIAILHDAANHHRAEDRPAEAKVDFQRLLEINPGDYNVRVALAQYADPITEPQTIYELLKPAIEIYCSQPDVYGAILHLYARVVFARGDVVEAVSMAEHMRELSAAKPYLDRVDLLAQGELGEPASPAEEWLGHAMMALDEWRFIQCLGHAEAALETGNDTTEAFGLRAIMAARVARTLRWTRPYRMACRLVSRTCTETLDSAALHEAWVKHGLPQEALSAFGSSGSSGRSPTGTAEDALDIVESARPEWAKLWRSGRFEAFLKVTPSGASNNPLPLAEAISRLRLVALSVTDIPVEQGGADLWLFLTWHEDPHQLLRQLSALVADRVRIIVSIGGDGLPQDLGVASVPLMTKRFDFLFNPVVAWGGQRLLFHNLYIGLKAFGKAPDDARMQVICNRSYPLLPTAEMAALLLQPDFVEQYPGEIAPPVWQHEWPEEILNDLPQIFDRAVDDVFKYADGTSFHNLSTMRGTYFGDSDFRKDQSAFNFSSKAQPLDPRYKGSTNDYSISPYGVDMRWMSFARLVEFVDASTESRTTYTRRLHPLVAKWIHSVLIQHNLRTGDPFFMTTPRLARQIFENPEAVELFTVMNHGFGPEMNFFDTLAMTPKYELRDHVQHLYFRAADGFAMPSDIEPAAHAADTRKRLFLRKTNAESRPFIEHFGGRIAAHRGLADYFVALTGERSAGAPTATIGTPRTLLESLLVGRVFRIRTLFDALLKEAIFHADMTVRAPDNELLGSWAWSADGALVVSYVIHDWAIKTYPSIISDGTRITLAPDEIVSRRNRWGVFIDIDFADFLGEPRSARIISEEIAVQAFEQPILVTGSPVDDVALLGGFALEKRPELPGVWDRHAYSAGEIRHAGAETLVSFSLDDVPTVGRISRVAFGDERAVAIIDFSAPDLCKRWDAAPAGQIKICLDSGHIAGRWVFHLLDRDIPFSLAADFRLIDGSGADRGIWAVRGSTIWIVGLSEAPVIVASQFVWTHGVWTMSGWCSRGLGDLTSFSLEPAIERTSATLETSE